MRTKAQDKINYSNCLGNKVLQCSATDEIVQSWFVSLLSNYNWIKEF